MVYRGYFDFSQYVQVRLSVSVIFIGNTGKGKSSACEAIATANLI